MSLMVFGGVWGFFLVRMPLYDTARVARSSKNDTQNVMTGVAQFNMLKT